MTVLRLRSAVFLLALAGCDEAPNALAIPGADPARGRALVVAYGCGSCHVIEGVPGARGMVGPSLERFALRTTFAGRHPNVPANLVPFLVDPPAWAPGTAMPAVGLDRAEAADIASYLYTLGSDAQLRTQEWLDQPLPEG